MIAIDRGSGGVPSDDPVRVPITVDSGVQQVHVHEILRVRDRIRPRSEVALGQVPVGDARGAHDALVDVSALVVSSRVQARVRPA